MQWFLNNKKSWLRKQVQYAWYIIRHKFYTLKFCQHYGILWRGIVHDLSKLRPCEWGPYAEYFYGWTEDPYTGELVKSSTLPPVKAAFELAWLQHQKRNPHHWQWWLLPQDDGTVKALEMPHSDLLEMLADWTGAGAAIKGEYYPEERRKWYVENADKMTLHPSTRVEVELYLGIEKKPGGDL